VYDFITVEIAQDISDFRALATAKLQAINVVIID
jgi:hypothetical protein